MLLRPVSPIEGSAGRIFVFFYYLCGVILY